ncbi:MAG TPA: helix-turn-helix domain-containing protein [Chloroflexota bacterium]|nr:helix-turn-helix domain-containing protein [Chloroflexota bacterium]
MTATPAISLLDFRLPDGADVPFEIGRLETTHRLHANTRPHRHRFHEIIWFVEGAGAYTADFEEHTIRPQTVFLVSPGQVHAERVDRPLGGYMLLFTPDFLAPEGGVPDGSAALPFFRPGTANPVLALTGEDAGRLRAVAEDLLAEFAAPDAWRRDMLRARLHVLLLALGRVARRQGVLMAPPASPVARFQALVDDHFQRLHRVAEYARLLGLTPGHLNDLTRATTGQKASALIQARLVLEAKRLLAHSDAPVAEIAAHLAFADPAYFGRFFRRHVDRSPGAFRAAIREKYQDDR